MVNIIVQFQIGEALYSLLCNCSGQSPSSSPPPLGCFKPMYIPFLRYSQSECGFHFLVNARTIIVHHSPCSFYLTRSRCLWQISTLVVWKFGIQAFNLHQKLAIAELIERKINIFINFADWPRKISHFSQHCCKSLTTHHFYSILQATIGAETIVKT